jgi:hypothetical protein
MVSAWDLPELQVPFWFFVITFPREWNIERTSNFPYASNSFSLHTSTALHFVPRASIDKSKTQNKVQEEVVKNRWRLPFEPQ